MRVHRLLIRELTPGRRVVRGSEAHHLRDVLRVRPGSPIEAFDGDGRTSSGRVAAVFADRVELELEPAVRSAVEPPVSITLAVALLKGDKLADVVRKGTELGVARFAPFVSTRCDATRLAPNKLVRLRRIAEEASKQSGRSRVPDVADPITLGDLRCDELTLVGAPTADTTLREALGAAVPERLTLVSGPEGGLDPNEIDRLRARGARPIRLGARILRAETAPVALASAILVPEAW